AQRELRGTAHDPRLAGVELDAHGPRRQGPGDLAENPAGQHAPAFRVDRAFNDGLGADLQIGSRELDRPTFRRDQNTPEHRQRRSGPDRTQHPRRGFRKRVSFESDLHDGLLHRSYDLSKTLIFQYQNRKSSRAWGRWG